MPVEVLIVDDAISIGAGGYHTAEINTDCTMRAWGDNAEGQLGDNTIIDSPTAVQVIISPATPFDLGSCSPSDKDSDGIPDCNDNCPDNCNVQQLDADGDGIGDVCDTDPGCGGCGQAQCEQQCLNSWLVISDSG